MSRWAGTVDVAMDAVLAAFGDPVAYRPAGDADQAVEIEGVFDEAHQAVDPGTGVPISTTAPALTVRVADLPRPPVAGDALTVDGRDWLVMDVQPDGAGNSLLKLHRDHGR
ncbi:head-tail joining protein [Fodinicurvata sp. EGI_FJ10296]|uniref:head-tail joining protein n=1 Tax=Fodinicurvata sp. EGI_FJ10296 TaxID=3231908 RepID=UPI0034573AF4